MQHVKSAVVFLTFPKISCTNQVYEDLGVTKVKEAYILCLNLSLLTLNILVTALCEALVVQLCRVKEHHFHSGTF